MFMKEILIIGASGHGKVVADIAKKNGYNNIMFLDDNIFLNKCGEYDVIGKTDSYEMYDCDMIVAIGNPLLREKFQKKLLSAGKRIVSLVHPNAIVAENVKLGIGTVVAAGSIINPDAIIGEGCIINTNSSVDHDCKIANYVHISVGAHVAGTVSIGERTWIGIGATVSNNICICEDCMIGAGAVVVKTISDVGTYIGVPAKKIKKL